MTGHRRLLALFVLACLPFDVSAQEPPAGPPGLPDDWRQGFVAKVSGDTLIYPWAYPGQVPSLLSRATDGAMAVEWDAEPAPPGGADTPVTYLWLAGTASGSGAHRFALSVNGTEIATFRSGRTTADRGWTVDGAHGARLSFRATRIGQFDELFGFMWLTAPRSLFGAGAPRFRVVGEAAGRQDYYLGPQRPVETWTRVTPEQALFADGQRVVSVGISHVGPDAPARVTLGGAAVWSGTVGPGHTAVLVPAGPNEARTVAAQVVVGGRVGFDGPVALAAVRPRAIHVLPHSHVDIGYSDPQPEVERKQWKNLRDALALIRTTAGFPAEARFKWNVEGLWSVESFLAQASPQERAAFADAVRAGSMGLQANYTNILTGLATPVELRRWTDAARRVQAQLGVGPIRSAMHSDIPGLSWTTVDALAEGGVRYFSSGPNYMPGLPDGGDRIGGTLQALGDRPFWWASPSGNARLLFWMAGRGYSWFHGVNAGRVADDTRLAILAYVKGLVDTGYRYDFIQVRYTIGGDNGPVDPDLPAFVRSWNERFASPRLVIDTAESLFDAFERRHGADLPVMAGDMTPYWEDGALSSAADDMAVRAASRRLHQAEMLAALRGVRLPADDRAAAWRNVLLWREHTWGAADSISQPDRADVVAQWEYKRRFATEADRQSRQLLDAALPSRGTAPSADIDVVNVLARPRSGLVYLAAERSAAGDRVLVVPRPGAGPRLPAPAAPAVRAPTVPELAVPSQRLRDGRLAVWLEHVPALSSVRLRVTAGPAVTPAVPARATAASLDNGRVALTIDPQRGGATSLRWAGAAGRELLPPGDTLFQYLYVDGRDPARAAPFTGGRATVVDEGPLVAAVRIDGVPAGTSAASLTVSVVAGSDDVFAELAIEKTGVRSKESAHVAFPFAVPDGRIRADQGEAFVELEHDQLPGSCRDFIGVHSAIDVSAQDVGITLVSLDAALIQPGALTDERPHERGTRTWRTRTAPGSRFYAYLLNNYWHTNYKADQPGPVRARFAVRPHRGFDPLAVRAASDDHDVPLLAVPARGPAPLLRAPFALAGDPVAVTAIDTSDDGSLRVRLYNPFSAPAAVVLEPGGDVVVPPRAVRIVTIAGGRTPGRTAP